MSISKTYSTKIISILSSRVLIYSLIFLAIIIRLTIYATVHSMHLDEAQVALNIIHNSMFELLNPSPDQFKEFYEAPRPIGFMLLARLAIILLSEHEYVLRGMVLIVGILSIFLYKKFHDELSNSKSLIFGIILFVFNSYIILYSIEFKHYIFEVFFTMALLLFYVPSFKTKIKVKEIIVLGSLAMASILFSFTSIFVLIGLLLTHIIYLVDNKKLKSEPQISLLLIFILGFWYVCIYSKFITPLVQNDLIQDNMNFASMSFPFITFLDQKKFIILLMRMFYIPGNFSQALLALILFIIGFICLYRREKYSALALLTPLLLTIGASIFNKYAFWERLLLFYTPCIIYLVVEGLVGLFNYNKKVVKVLAIFLGIYLFGSYLSQMGRYPFTQAEVKPVLKYIQANIEDDDFLYISCATKPAFQYYAKRYDLWERNFIKNNDINSFRHDDCYQDFELPLGKRVWIIVSQPFPFLRNGKEMDREVILRYFNAKGKLLDKVVSKDSSGYLFYVTHQ